MQWEGPGSNGNRDVLHNRQCVREILGLMGQHPSRPCTSTILPSNVTVALYTERKCFCSACARHQHHRRNKPLVLHVIAEMLIQEPC